MAKKNKRASKVEDQPVKVTTMPEISQMDLNQFQQFQALGMPPAEVAKKIKDLERDNKKQRDEIREMTEKVPKDGEVVVKKEDADNLTAYKELGEAKEIKDKLEAGEKAKTSLQNRETRDAAATFAKAAGLDDATVDTIVAIPAFEGAKFEVRKVKKDDEETEVAYVTLKGDGEKAMSFEDAADKVTALKGLKTAEPEKKGGGKEFVQQTPSGKKKPGENVYDRVRRESKERKETAKPSKAAVATTQDTVLKNLGMH